MIFFVIGVVGFIGVNIVCVLFDVGYVVVGLDNYNDYYDLQIKCDCVVVLCLDVDICVLDFMDCDGLVVLFDEVKLIWVIYFVVQVGVCYLLENLYVYVDSNLVGFVNMFELCCYCGVVYLVYVFSSLVYGDLVMLLFFEDQCIDQLCLLYVVIKVVNELMVYIYVYLYGLCVIGLCFFIVYGLWGCFDMVLLLFLCVVLVGCLIDVFNDGKMQCDFIYVFDIVVGIFGVLVYLFGEEVLYCVFNLGNYILVELEYFIGVIEVVVGCLVYKVYKFLQFGDMVCMMVDIMCVYDVFGYELVMFIECGLLLVVVWCCDYFGDYV